MRLELSDEQVRTVLSALKYASEDVSKKNRRVRNLPFPHNRPIGWGRPMMWTAVELEIAMQMERGAAEAP